MSGRGLMFGCCVRIVKSLACDSMFVFGSAEVGMS